MTLLDGDVPEVKEGLCRSNGSCCIQFNPNQLHIHPFLPKLWFTGLPSKGSRAVEQCMATIQYIQENGEFSPWNMLNFVGFRDVRDNLAWKSQRGGLQSRVLGETKSETLSSLEPYTCGVLIMIESSESKKWLLNKWDLGPLGDGMKIAMDHHLSPIEMTRHGNYTLFSDRPTFKKKNIG